MSNNSAIYSEAFNSIRQIHKDFLNESLSESKILDEKAPRDLMNSIKNAEKRGWGYNRNNYDFNTGTGDISKDYNGKERTGVIDYENATYDKITPAQLRKMKANGEDLSKVYVTREDPTYGGKTRFSHVRLDRQGHPDLNRSSNHDLRSNQSLDTTLKGAKDIYLSNEPDLIDSQPEKARQRIPKRDEDDYNGYWYDTERQANAKLGHDRKLSDEIARYQKWIDDSSLRADETAIKAAHKAFDDGDISRKERDSRIASAKKKRHLDADDYDVSQRNAYENSRTNARYFAANKALQEPMRKFNSLKRDITSGTSTAQRQKADLNDIRTNRENSSEFSYERNRIKELQDQIKNLQNQINMYQGRISTGTSDDAIQRAEKQLAATEDKLAKDQAEFNKLMRRA